MNLIVGSRGIRYSMSELRSYGVLADIAHGVSIGVKCLLWSMAC